jgi:hypothetical protein
MAGLDAEEAEARSRTATLAASPMRFGVPELVMVGARGLEAEVTSDPAEQSDAPHREIVRQSWASLVGSSHVRSGSGFLPPMASASIE